MKIGFTGTRHGMTNQQKNQFFKIIINLNDLKEFHHGDCIGADALMQIHILLFKIIIQV